MIPHPAVETLLRAYGNTAEGRAPRSSPQVRTAQLGLHEQRIGMHLRMPRPAGARGIGDTEMTDETWYAHPNDLIGGWSVLNRNHPPSRLNRATDPDGREVATFMSEADARRIAELHNAEVAGRLLPDGGETRTEWGVRSRAGEVSPAFDEADARDLAARRAAVGRPAKVVCRPLWTGPWVEVTDEPA